MSLTRMILRRLLWILPVAFGVVTITFFLARVFAGNPAELYTPPEATDELRAQIKARLGLADPLPVQYLRYMGALLHGDLGTSFSTGQKVAVDLTDRLPATLELGLVGLCIGIAAGVPLGVLAAVNRERWPDFLVRGVTLGGMALPQFWIGLVLIWIFFVSLGWLPGITLACRRWRPSPGHPLGDGRGDAERLHPHRDRHGPRPRRRLVPLRLAQRAAARGHADRRRGRPYLRRRRTAGIDLRLAGPGQYALQSIDRSDFAALQGFVIYASLLYVIAFTAVDVLYLLIDPRMRT